MLSVADAEVGRPYLVSLCGREAKTHVVVHSRSKTHTYLRHAKGDLAIPNNMSADLISLKEYEYTEIPKSGV